MPFGGLAPLPLRLGGSRQDGLSVADHARLAADLAGILNTSPFAVFTYTSNGGSDPTLHSYIGMNGVGLSHAPTPLALGTGNVLWAWAKSYEDEYGKRHEVKITRGRLSCSSSSLPIIGSANATGINALRLETWRMDTGADADALVTAVAYS